MLGEEKIRTLLAPADPALGREVSRPTVSAAELIARAEDTSGAYAHRVAVSAPARRGRPSRRLVLAAAGLTVVGGVAVAVYPDSRGGRSTPVPTDDAVGGTVLVPIAYQIATNPPPAGEQLRALAARLAPAPYDTRSGTYAYHDTKSWGGIRQMSPEGYVMSYVEERKTWVAPDGSGRITRTTLAPEFPDERSRTYWMGVLKAPRPTPTDSQAPSGPQDLPAGMAGPSTPLPTGEAELARKITEGRTVYDTVFAVNYLYNQYVVPRQTRATILRLLAGVPGLAWRGKVTDRAGRTGVAVTAYDKQHESQTILVFDPRTGELLAHEDVAPKPKLPLGRVSYYNLFLAYDRTNQLG